MNYEKWTFIVLCVLAIEHFFMSMRFVLADRKRVGKEESSLENQRKYNKELYDWLSLVVKSTNDLKQQHENLFHAHKEFAKIYFELKKEHETCKK